MQDDNRDDAITSGMQQQDRDVLLMATVPIGLLINHAMGTLTLYLKLPIYLDNIGTLLVTILVGTSAGVVTGILSSFFGGLLINPIIPCYTGGHIAITWLAGWMASKGFFRTIPRTIVTGILIGLLSGICTVPIVMLFDGFSGTCTDVTTALLLASGQSLFTSAFLANFANEPFDKTLQCLIVIWLIRGFPKNLKAWFTNSGYLMKNVVK